MRVPCERGFTVTELLVTVGIVGILATVAIWEIERTLPEYRVGAAASRFLLDLRTTAAIAARTNRPATFRVITEGENCALRYLVEQDGTVYQNVCLTDELRGMTTVEDLDAIRCPEENGLGLAELPACSLCDGGSIVFLPTGQVLSTDPVGDTIVFRSADDEDGLVRAVGIRAGGIGRARVYQWTGTEWLCR